MSDTAPDTGDTTDAAETTETDTDQQVDWQAEAEKWKTQARKHEDRAKANATAAKELDQLRQSTMTDLEKAVDQARKEGRTEALREVASSRVDDAVRVAVAGRDVDVDALLEGLDRSRFVTEDGEPDAAAVAAWVDRIAPKPDETERTETPFPDLVQGARSSTKPLNGDPLLRDVKSVLGIR